MAVVLVNSHDEGTTSLRSSGELAASCEVAELAALALASAGPLFGFLDDILSDEHANPPILHWIVQRLGSAEIIHSGQELTQRQAEKAADTFLKQRARKGRRRNAD